MADEEEKEPKKPEILTMFPVTYFPLCYLGKSGKIPGFEDYLKGCVEKSPGDFQYKKSLIEVTEVGKLSSLTLDNYPKESLDGNRDDCITSHCANPKFYNSYIIDSIGNNGHNGTQPKITITYYPLKVRRFGDDPKTATDIRHDNWSEYITMWRWNKTESQRIAAVRERLASQWTSTK
jgi:hypothetical protein